MFNRKGYIFGVYLLVVLIGVSCQREDTKAGVSEIEIDTDDATVRHAGDLFSEVQVTPLQSQEKDFLLGEIEKIVETDGGYLILDNQSNKALFYFDKDGKPIARFKKAGKGPEEYLDIWDFDEENGQLVLLCYPMKLLVLDKSNLSEVKKEIPLNSYYRRLALREGKILLYDHEGRKVDLLDPESGTTSTLHSWEENRGLPMSPVCIFYRLGGRLFMQPRGNDNIYEYADTDFQPALVMDYPKKAQAVQFYSNREVDDPIEDFRELGKYPMPNLQALYEQDGQLALLYSTFMFRVNTPGKNGRTDTNITFPGNSYQRLLSKDGRQLITWAFPHELEGISEQDMKGLDKAAFDLSEDSDNPVIIRYTLK